MYDTFFARSDDASEQIVGKKDPWQSLPEVGPRWRFLAVETWFFRRTLDECGHEGAD